MKPIGSLIINPNAGGKRAAKRSGALVTAANSRWRTFFTSGFEAAVRQTKQLFLDGERCCIAVGGDGALSSVLNGFMQAKLSGPIHPEACIGVIPLGTGNDTAAALGLPRDPLANLSRLETGRAVMLDVAKLIQPDKPEQFYIDICGVGFDAQVNANMDVRFKKRFGLVAYLAAVAKTLAKLHPIHVRLALDQIEYEAPVTLIAIANGPMYGRGMKVAPLAKFNDGMLDVIIVEQVGRIELAVNFPKVFRGTHLSHPKIRMMRARSIEIQVDPPQPLSVDGESLGCAPCKIEVMPRCVPFLLPDRCYSNAILYDELDETPPIATREQADRAPAEV